MAEKIQKYAPTPLASLASVTARMIPLETSTMPPSARIGVSRRRLGSKRISPIAPARQSTKSSPGAISGVGGVNCANKKAQDEPSKADGIKPGIKRRESLKAHLSHCKGGCESFHELATALAPGRSAFLYTQGLGLR